MDKTMMNTLNIYGNFLFDIMIYDNNILLLKEC